MAFKIITVDELLKMLDKYNHKELHVHHTWRPSHKDYNGSNGITLQNGMRNYHVNSRGWQDIGQHITLLPDGKIVTGRNFGIAPASITGHNTGSFAMEMLGNFDKGQDKFEGKQKENALKIAKYFIDKGRYVRFHRENSGKTCPGSSINKTTFMNEVRNVDNVKVDKLVNREKPKAKTNTRKDKIKEIQSTLNERYNAGLAVDGIPGPLTKKAFIKAYQIELNNQFNARLKVDGIFGPKTRKASVNVKEGAKGNLTWIIQALLYIKGYDIDIDGIFGGETDKAVKAFQKKHRLAVDGIAGKNTWRELFK